MVSVGTEIPRYSLTCPVDKPKEKKPTNRYNYGLALRIAGDFGVSIAVPALLGAYVGQKLDERFGTEPWLFALCLVIAFTLTALYIVRKATYYAKLYDKGE